MFEEENEDILFLNASWTPDENAAAVASFQGTDWQHTKKLRNSNLRRPRLLVGTYWSHGTGVTLHKADVEILVSAHYSEDVRRHARGRIHRLTKDHPTLDIQMMSGEVRLDRARLDGEALHQMAKEYVLGIKGSYNPADLENLFLAPVSAEKPDQ